MPRNFWISVAIACLFTGIWSLAARAFSIEQGDFPAFYTGAQVALSGKFGSLHDVKLQAALQKQATQGRRPEVTYFVRPHVYAAVLAPLALMDLRTAYVSFLIVCAALLIAIGVWGCGQFGPDALVLLSLFPLPVFATAFGQDSLLYLALIVASYHFHNREKPLVSGFILGLAAIKPHLLVLIPLAMLIQRRWRMLAGLAIGGAVQTLLSLMLAGWSGATLYLSFLGQQRNHLSPHPERMLNINSLLLNLGIGESIVLEGIAMAGILICVFMACRGAEWWRALAAGVAGTLIIAPHTIPYDAVWMILPAWLVFFKSASRLAKAAAAIFFTPIPYLAQLADQPWSGLPACVLVFFVISIARDTFAPAKSVLVPVTAPQ
jgi:hypothetical protein